jgi:pfkB family carbohydrate kinase
MRTCMEGCTRLQVADVKTEDLQSKFVVLSSYCMYGPGFTDAVVQKAEEVCMLVAWTLLPCVSLVHVSARCACYIVAGKAELTALQAGAAAVLDLASWEIVERFNEQLWAIITSGSVYALTGNQDEWLALAECIKLSSPVLENGRNGTMQNSSRSSTDHGNRVHLDKERLQQVSAAQKAVLQHCQVAVTTRGSAGCLAMDRQSQCCEPAVHVSNTVDTTGAGDLFAAGFMHGLLRGHDLQTSCRIGCITGAAATQVCP